MLLMQTAYGSFGLFGSCQYSVAPGVYQQLLANQQLITLCTQSWPATPSWPAAAAFVWLAPGRPLGVYRDLVLCTLSFYFAVFIHSTRWACQDMEIAEACIWGSLTNWASLHAFMLLLNQNFLKMLVQFVHIYVATHVSWFIIILVCLLKMQSMCVHIMYHFL